MTTNLDVRDNAAVGRYEVSVEGQLAVLEYRRRDGTISLTHTEVPKALEGRGIGSVLVRRALEDARERGQVVVPACPFVRTYIKRHREYVPLLEAHGKPAESDACELPDVEAD